MGIDKNFGGALDQLLRTVSEETPVHVARAANQLSLEFRSGWKIIFDVTRIAFVSEPADCASISPHGDRSATSSADSPDRARS
jgi:hypothetical protein